MNLDTSQLLKVFQKALQHHQAGRLEQASVLYRKILAKMPQHAGSMHMLGVVAHQDGNYQEAVQLIHEAIRLNPKAPSFHNNLGNALQELGNLKQAEQSFRNAVILKPDYAGAKYNLANLLIQQNNEAAGFALYQEILSESPTFVDAYRGGSELLLRREQWAQADKLLRRAVKIAPKDADILFRLGEVFRLQGLYDKALATYQRCLEMDADHVMANNNAGALLQLKGRLEDAIDLIRVAIQHDPTLAEAHFNLGNCLENIGRLVDAEDAYQAALRLEPDFAAQVYYYLCMTRRKLCDWQNEEERIEELVKLTEKHIRTNYQVPLPPLTLSMLPVEERLRSAVARHYARTIERKITPLKLRTSFEHARVKPQRLRIGYVSADFRQHAVGTLVQGMFQHHDRSEFEVYAYSLVGARDSYTENIKRAVDRFQDVSKLSAEAIARKVKEDGIHILIDLTGYTTFAKTELFALRPAPVQAHYLGYLGTMGAGFLPYTIVDPHVMTEELASKYREACVYLPETFMVTSPRVIASKPFSREKAGLDRDTFVFCCFNSLHKIDAHAFEVWMQILKRVPNSILWLNDPGMTRPKMNLQKAVRKYGIETFRVRYAKRLPVPEYLARYRAADLFLDTFSYNAGATAVDALYTGLPVLTLTGSTVLSRMGTSLVHAAGAPELACTSHQEYIAKAVHYAENKDELKALRHRLLNEREQQPLFDTRRFVRHLEAGFRAMWQQYLAGERPSTIHVEPIPQLAKSA